MNIRSIATIAATACVLTAGLQDAQALGLINRPVSNAAGNCQPAMPVYDGNIRKRPLAVVNEGTKSAYVTCGLTTDSTALGVIEYSTRVRNQSDAPITITCTGAAGIDSSPQYFVKSVPLAAGASTTISWVPSDNGNLLYPHPVSLSCLLPPGGALNQNSSVYLVQII